MTDVEHRADGRKVDVESKISEERKQRNARRFLWHEQLIKSVGSTLLPTSVLLAGLILHERSLTTKGYVAFSLKDAAAELKVSKQAIINARNQLVAMGWLEQVAFRGQKKAHYKVAFPPSTVH